MRFFLVIFFLIITGVYWITSGGNTPYDYFTRLADALLHGRYWLTENPTWLNELIPWQGGRYYFVNPPAPALLSLPFVFLFRDAFRQDYLSYMIGAGLAVSWGVLAWRLTNKRSSSLWSGLFIGLGSTVWFLSSAGSAWYLGQITAALFISLALIESLGRKRLVLIALLLIFAFFSRTQTVLSLPFFVYMLRHELSGRKLVGFGLLMASFPVLWGFYNYARFGLPFEAGYSFIPGILSEPWFAKGHFHPSYIPRHLKIMFAGLPKFSISEVPYVWPSWAGQAIWITTPGFIYALTAPLLSRETAITWLTIVMIAGVNFSFGSTGFTQFGYRYAVDFYPFLMLLVVRSLKEKAPAWHHWLLLFVGIAVNAWGVLWINKFGWVSF